MLIKLAANKEKEPLLTRNEKRFLLGGLIGGSAAAILPGIGPLLVPSGALLGGAIMYEYGKKK